MKMKLKLILSILLLSVVMLAVQSCGDDGRPAKTFLLTCNRVTGQFYTLNAETGQLRKAFAIKYDGDTLKDIRSVVYHPGKKALYITTNSADINEDNYRGWLFSVNKKTKVATLINDNDGDNTVGGGTYDVWDAVVNWAVDADDSLIAVGDFNDDGNGFVKFGTNGDRSLETVTANLSDGCGMVYDPETKEALVGTNPPAGAVFVRRFDVETGESLESFTLNTFTGFPESFVKETSSMKLKGLAVNSAGKYFGLVYNYSDDSGHETYFVSLDFETLTVTYINTLGLSYEDQYNVLTFISDANF